MAGNAIHFGTSGWRGIMAEDFTFTGVRPYALDPEHAKALWAKSEAMVGERFA